MWALILNNKVWQIEDKKFPFAPPAFWVECGPEITTQHTYVNGNFVEPGEYTPPIIPDSIFQKAVKRMVKGLMLFNGSVVSYVNGEITKDQLNNRFDLLQAEYDAIKEYIENIID